MSKSRQAFLQPLRTLPPISLSLILPSSNHLSCLLVSLIFTAWAKKNIKHIYSIVVLRTEWQTASQTKSSMLMGGGQLGYRSEHFCYVQVSLRHVKVLQWDLWDFYIIYEKIHLKRLTSRCRTDSVKEREFLGIWQGALPIKFLQ